MATQRPSVDVITGTVKANFQRVFLFKLHRKLIVEQILRNGCGAITGNGGYVYMAGGQRLLGAMAHL